MIQLDVINRMLAHHLVALPPAHASGVVDWVTGAAVMFRLKALRDVGFFDPGFFLYYEEVDLMRRLQAAGWRIRHVHEAQVIHEEGAATGQFAAQAGRQRDPAYLYQSWAHYFCRALGRPRALCLALLLWPAAALNILHRRLRGRPPRIPLKFFRDHWRFVLRPLLSGQSGK
ncbi:MAG: glycosyltransferase family 2 protein [Pseudomonadota bacterium]